MKKLITLTWKKPDCDDCGYEAIVYADSWDSPMQLDLRVSSCNPPDGIHDLGQIAQRRAMGAVSHIMLSMDPRGRVTPERLAEMRSEIRGVVTPGETLIFHDTGETITNTDDVETWREKMLAKLTSIVSHTPNPAKEALASLLDEITNLPVTPNPPPDETIQ